MTLKISLTGAGYIAEIHARAPHNAGAEIYAVVEAYLEKAAAFAKKFHIPRPEHCPQSMYDAQMAHFLNCIQTGALPSPGSAEGLVNMKIVDAAYASSRSGQVIQIGI